MFKDEQISKFNAIKLYDAYKDPRRLEPWWLPADYNRESIKTIDYFAITKEIMKNEIK